MAPDQRELLDGLFNWLVEPCLVLLRKELDEYFPTQDTTLAWAVCNLLECSLAQAAEAKLGLADPITGEGLDGGSRKYSVGTASFDGKVEFSNDDLIGTFLFSLVWGLGGTLSTESRQKMDEFLRSAISEAGFLDAHALSVFYKLKGWTVPEVDMSIKGAAAFPGKDSIYDHMYCPGDSRWRSWDSLLPKVNIPENAEFRDIIIPTIATLQFDHIVPLLMARGKGVLVCGPTGTGKSVAMNRLVLKTLPKERFLPIVVGFSAQTSAGQT